MQLFDDTRGLAVTADSGEAVRHLDATLDAYLGFRCDTGEHLKRALAADPELVMGHATRGCFMMLFETAPFRARARKSLAAAKAALAARGGTERERRHVAALKRWAEDGDFAGATALWDDILIDAPRDVLALKLAQYGHFYLGESDGMRDSLGRVLYAWDEKVPGYGFVLGSYAFALEEAGEYARAEFDGRRAVEINPADIWAAHAVAHVLETQGRRREGVRWIGGLECHWAPCNNFRFHALWHRGLFLWELGEHDRVLELYDREVRAESTDEYLDITNAVALLFRLEQAGVDVGNRWAELAARSAAYIDDHCLVFADAHYAMALAAAGEAGSAERLLAGARAQAERGAGTEAEVMRETGLALCEAALAHRRGEWGRVVDLLMPVRARIRRVGGSHAQRDLFSIMLIDAALRAGRSALARALLSERLQRNPASPWSWKTYAAALEQTGDAAGAAKAKEEAETRLSAA